MLATKILAVAIALIVSGSAFADSTCDANAKTRDEFLNCSKAETEKLLLNFKKIYESIRKLAKDEKRIELDRNCAIFGEKLKSDCSMIAYSFNDWGGVIRLILTFRYRHVVRRSPLRSLTSTNGSRVLRKWKHRSACVT
ncbi:exported hypothetical protein [Paraburkholderia sacchari]